MANSCEDRVAQQSNSGGNQLSLAKRDRPQTKGNASRVRSAFCALVDF
jgi:hypothetical protein